MVKKAKDKKIFFPFFFVYEVAVYFFGLFDVCVKQCPTINILLSCSNKKILKIIKMGVDIKLIKENTQRTKTIFFAFYFLF